MTAVPENEFRVLNDRHESSNRLEHAMLGVGTLFVLTAVVLALVMH
jgi:hypothetical protein